MKDRLRELVDEAARRAVEAGIPADDRADGPLAAWVRANCKYRLDLEIFVVFLIACRMGELQ